ncbi:MAG: class I SAM-dependent methyltransferase [Candidatus Limnocylindrales bacterium]
MNRHEFLRELHALTRPRNYLEIGVNDGKSLALSRVPTIGVDPAFKITVPIHCDVQLIKATSDAFFARKDPIRHLRSSRDPRKNVRRGRPLFGAWIGKTTVDLAFIDGLHLFEFALRDFMNIERLTGPSSVVVMDDMLPRNVDEAARDRHTGEWAGDVYKVIPVLREFRPDLVLIPVDTTPTGVLVVLGTDATSTVLRENYDEIIARWVVADPQDIPADILERRIAVDPERLLASSLWRTVARKGRGGSRAHLDAIRGEIGGLSA